MITVERATVASDSSAPRSTLSVFVVDSDPKVRERLVAIIRAAGWQPRAFGSAEDLLGDPRSFEPGCIVLDVDLPGLSGLELQQRLAERAGMSVIFASACRDLRLTVRAMKAGALNFLTQPVDRDALVGAVTEALECSRTSLRREAEERALRQRFDALSAREREVMRWVIAGRLNKQIASELAIAEITVKVHRGRVMRKLGATSLADLVRLGAKLGVAGKEGRRNTRAAVGARQSIGESIGRSIGAASVRVRPVTEAGHRAAAGECVRGGKDVIHRAAASECVRAGRESAHRAADVLAA
jgi:FixJ family two-component response regulator